MEFFFIDQQIDFLPRTATASGMAYCYCRPKHEYESLKNKSVSARFKKQDTDSTAASRNGTLFHTSITLMQQGIAQRNNEIN